MIEPVIGIIGGSGIYDIEGLEDKVWRQVATPWGMPSDALLFGRLARRALRVPAAPRAWPPAVADASQLSRQHRRTEALRRHRRAVAVRGRQPEAGTAARALRHRRPVHRPQLRAREELLRRRHRRACVDGAPRVLAAWRRAGGRRARPRPAGDARRHLSRDGRPAVLHQGGERALPLLGLQRDRHDQHAGGEARARGRAELRHRRDGDRLRLLAPGPRPRHGRGRGARAAGQRRQGARRWCKVWCPEIGKPREACPAGCDRALDNAIITAQPHARPAAGRQSSTRSPDACCCPSQARRNDSHHEVHWLRDLAPEYMGQGQLCPR